MAAGARKERVGGNSNVVQFYNFMVHQKGTRRHASILEGLGHCGEHPAKSGSRLTPEQAQRNMPNQAYNAYASTAPVLRRPVMTKTFLDNSIMFFAFP